jgi:branched-chain amino acid transport system substrate-binding protein
MAGDGIETVKVLGGGGGGGGGDDFGEALAAGIGAAPGAPQIVTAGRPDAAFAVYPENARLGVPAAPTYGSDALLEPSLRQPGPGAGSVGPLRVVSAALDPSELPAAADGFLASFRGAYGRRPGRYAAYGYEATALALDSIDRAGDPLDRGSVVDAFFATEDRDSILGTYSIDSVGDTTLPTLGAYAIGADLKPRPSPSPLQLP